MSESERLARLEAAIARLEAACSGCGKAQEKLEEWRQLARDLAPRGLDGTYLGVQCENCFFVDGAHRPDCPVGKMQALLEA